jgi:xanthine dehydrogenase accessory factor
MVLGLPSNSRTGVERFREDMNILLRGGGDLASGVAVRLWRVGLRVVIIELPKPMAVRRKVAFSEAVYQGVTVVEDIRARLVGTAEQCDEILDRGEIPVLVDPILNCLEIIRPAVLVDARMKKRSPETDIDVAPMVIGIGPGFIAGENCHAVIETKRGHKLGRVIWTGKPQEDTGVPEGIANHHSERVLRAPTDGVLETIAEIGDRLDEGQVVGRIEDFQVVAPFQGVLRGILPSGIVVSKGLKIGDVDPREEVSNCYLVSDKSLAIGGGVLEAILSRSELRSKLWV